MGDKRMYEFIPNYIVPPGDTIRETMEALNFPANEFAVRLSITEQSLYRILNGKQALSYKTANKLELVTGVPANFWNRLESQYRERLEKESELEELERDVEWLQKIPIKELENRGYINSKLDDKDKVRSVLSFFEVSSVEAFYGTCSSLPIVARKSCSYEVIPEIATTWIQMGQIESAKANVNHYNREVFLQNLDKIRELTILPPEEFVPQMTNLCAKSGVVLVLQKQLKGAPFCGVTKWLNNKKAMIVLSLRGESADHFWFSFFHEAAHLILHKSKQKVFIDSNNEEISDIEEEANSFASNFLIPEKYIIDLKCIRKRKDVTELAKLLKIDPSIVVGQYQHYTEKWSFFNDLKVKYEWVKK